MIYKPKRELGSKNHGNKGPIFSETYDISEITGLNKNFVYKA